MADKKEIKVNDRIFLLSAEEATKLPKEFLKSNNWWWLRTSGFDDELVATVTEYGRVFRSSEVANNTHGGVRPAIRFDRYEDLLNLDRTNSGYYKYLGKKWIDITKYIGFPCLLKKKPFKVIRRFDATVNCYAISEIRKWLLDWWYKAESIKRLLLKSVETEPKMTLDEAIEHCKEVAKNSSCKECAEDHRQLAGWLKELKKLRAHMKGE